VKGKPLTGGAGVSAGEEKEKGKRRCGPLRGRAIEGYWAEVPKGKARLIFFLFSKAFSNQFFSYQIQTKNLQTFHKIL
jgi:hypothetical protein